MHLQINLSKHLPETALSPALIQFYIICERKILTAPHGECVLGSEIRIRRWACSSVLWLMAILQPLFCKRTSQIC